MGKPVEGLAGVWAEGTGDGIVAREASQGCPGQVWRPRCRSCSRGCSKSVGLIRPDGVPWGNAAGMDVV